MPRIGYDEAAEARRREAEREKQRAELQKQIDRWNIKKSGVTSLVNKLKSEKRTLETYLDMWQRQKSKYNGNDMLVEVVIVNLFEGESADKVKQIFSEGIKKMDQTYLRVDELKGNVSKQIDKLIQQISDIDVMIRVLIQRKNAI